MAEDLYQVLGVPKSASEQDIKKAYRKLAKQYHPDVNPGNASAEERFKKVTAAFDVLSDTKKRRLYDEFGEDAAKFGFDESKAQAYRAYRQSAQAAGGGMPFDGNVDLGDLLNEIFGQQSQGTPYGDFYGRPTRRRGARPVRGEDLSTRLNISLADVVTCSERSFLVNRPAVCPTCQGAPNRKTPCSSCQGQGFVEEQKRLTVKIPPGVDTGSKIRLAGQGAAGQRGAPSGDLFIELEVADHPTFHREGQDLFFDLPVTIAEALLGAEVSIPTFDGKITLRVPPGSQSGKKLRLRGKGVPMGKSGERGDLYAVIQIRIPEMANEETKEAAKKLAKAYVFDVRADLSA